MFWTNFYLFLTIFVLLFRQMIINWVGIYAVESSILSILLRIKKRKRKRDSYLFSQTSFSLLLKTL